MGDVEAAAAILAELCGSLVDDAPDEMAYVAGMLADPDADLGAIVDDIAEMLEGFGVDNAGDVAAEAVSRVQEARGGGDGAVGASLPGASSDAPKKLSAAVTIADTTAEYERLAEATRDPSFKEVQVNSNAQDLEQVLVSLNDPKERRKRLEKTAKVVAQNDALQRDLEAARMHAVNARLSGVSVGAIGSIDAGPFDLPNPGGGANLIESCAFTLEPGRRYGLVGRNGRGKSCLLKWMAARREGCDSAAWKNATIHYVTQEVNVSPEAEEWTPGEYVLDAHVERRVLLQRLAEAEAALAAADGGKGAGGAHGGKASGSGGGGSLSVDHHDLDQIHARLEAIGAEGAPGRVEALLTHLGFSTELRARRLHELSGGWRVRCALAAALFAEPEILLLDEPTNHLSLEAVLWLQRELATSPTWARRIVVVVSHDRSFLNEVTTDTLHLSGVAKRVTAGVGNYAAWAKRRKVLQDAWARSKGQRAQRRKHLMDFIDGAGTYANVMKQVNMKKKQVEKIDLEEEQEAAQNAGLAEDAELPLRLEAGGALEQPAVVLRDVSFRYPGADRDLFAGVDLSVRSTDRIALLGENGAGKTTLVKVLTGDLAATKGEVERDRRARIQLVTQHHTDQLDLDLTPLLFMLDKYPGDGTYGHEQELRRHLSGCGIGADLAMSVIRGLSGGQRSRVSMAAVSFARPHVLILDEPTNNLDIEAVSALIDCVKSFEGGVVLVSHDEHFVKSVGADVHLVGDEPGRVTRAESFDAYLKSKRAALEA